MDHQNCVKINVTKYYYRKLIDRQNKKRKKNARALETDTEIMGLSHTGFFLG